MGYGPLLVFIHGFPDFWYSWRWQLTRLSSCFRVVAMDTRGYNLSGQPDRQQDYDLSQLAGDLISLIEALGEEKATVIGHDWGGIIAWRLAISFPQHLHSLIVINAPHFRGLRRELRRNSLQREALKYVIEFQKKDSHLNLNMEAMLALVAQDEQTREIYSEAFERSSVEGMMHYYRQNFPSPLYPLPSEWSSAVTVPVIQIHGLQDQFLLADTLTHTSEWVAGEYNLVTLQQAGHWPHHDMADEVTSIIEGWLAQHKN
ncbi:MAG: alpha/beta hydrolase [Gammaproteobacteria bacterium]|nr:alpha/beta hydrolase [Gammaproteobacteria bacterium]